MTHAANEDGHTFDFEQVRKAELEWIARRRESVGLPPPDDDLVGLAFSGGGIRSAVFNLGVLQSLEQGGLLRQVDYLSSVSGGGYIASCHSWLKARLPTSHEGSVFSASLASGGGSVLDWLRAHGKYLVSHRGYSIWTLVASVLAAIHINVLVIGPVLVAAVYALTLDWLPVAWPAWLALPGAHVPRGQHGYWLLLLFGVACLGAFPFVATLFAFAAGARLASVRRIDALRVLMGRLVSIGPMLIAIGLIPVLATLGESLAHLLPMRGAAGMGMHASWLVPALAGLAVLLVDRRKGGDGSGRLPMVALALLVYGILVGCQLIVMRVELGHSPLFAGLVALSVLLAFTCDINRVSLHAYYRARLAEAFMPVVAGDEGIHPASFRLDEAGPDRGAPLHLVNTTLNTTSSGNERLRARQGDSFFFSPLHAGSASTGYRTTASYADGVMALSTAFTISGAAVDPDMIDTRARPVSFLMALFNIRLGYWARNPRFAGHRMPLRPWWWIYISREMLGIGLDAQRHHVHLSDGGGFDNLGIYELVRRRVRRLMVVDAGADPHATLADLGRAIERVRVDFGAEIDLDADALHRKHGDAPSTRAFAIGTIRYADGSDGWITYLRPTLCEGLTADLYAYWRAHHAFPDEPTTEQFFGEAQFEAYRVLGGKLVAGMAREALETAPPCPIAGREAVDARSGSGG